MLTYNAILKELKNIPADRLEELYRFARSLAPKAKKSSRTKKKILSFGGSFRDMSAKDYDDFIKETKKTRTNLFDRDIEI